ncbi:MAG: dihydropyrimidinase [Anaerolineae bacterium CG_4_9_14_3_um_filter_57_17]|nr:dihydropyrimidinase [bacterium]NCT19900.1 dihydropyrimidinase [bacterium]OIO83412.1 MAG: dihydropyrimidinase [Anaerolineae bacterium CG2_30_57_67]PJB68711.1 MAG: dihydropyrimidinase [Anaerolineae bacterium CG_4_9_14_3_um_filter_57_17]
MLIKSATLITASDTFRADIIIEGEKILELLAPESEVSRLWTGEVLDAAGKFITPGGVDPHTHFDLPMFGTVSSDDHYTGHKAAAFGGTTTVMDFVPLEFPKPGANRASFAHSVNLWREKAAKAAVDYGFHMNLTRWDDALAAEFPALLEMGITTLKVFTAYNGRLRLSDGDIFEALRRAGELGMLVMAHCENGDVIEALIAEALAAGHTSPEWHARTRPAWGAVEATLRMAAMAAQANAPVYIVHLNAGGEADMLTYARQRGAPVMGETCPQYLFFNEDDLRRADGAKWVCSPPMRSAQDNARLWQALADGEIQTIGTDHCPFFFDGTQPITYEGKKIAIPGKELGKNDFTKIPNGLPGVQDRLPVLWTYGVRAGKISANQFVALTSTNPAKIFGLYPRKGALLPGSDADLVIWEAAQQVTYDVAHSHQRTDYNLYEGWPLTGYPEKVFLRGKLIVDGERWLGKAGDGQFLRRAPGEVL